MQLKKSHGDSGTMLVERMSFGPLALPHTVSEKLCYSLIQSLMTLSQRGYSAGWGNDPNY